MNDGLPETLQEVVARYGHRWFKLKVAGDANADIERLCSIASVLDRIPEPYHASLDGNEQYDDIAGVAELWSKMKAEARLRRLVDSIIFIEQPVKRAQALERKVAGIGRRVECGARRDEKPTDRGLGASSNGEAVGAGRTRGAERTSENAGLLGRPEANRGG